MAKKKTAPEKKISKVLKEYKAGTLHSGSKKGPIVSNPKQGIAIALSEARKKGLKYPKAKGASKEDKAEKTLAKRRK